MKQEVVEMTFHRIGKVNNFLEMWQGCQNPCTTKKKACTQNNKRTAIGYNLDMDIILKPSWSLFQHDGAAAFKLLETSPLLPALSAMDLP
jgi:hypothetical protein